MSNNKTTVHQENSIQSSIGKDVSTSKKDESNVAGPSHDNIKNDSTEDHENLIQSPQGTDVSTPRKKESDVAGPRHGDINSDTTEDHEIPIESSQGTDVSSQASTPKKEESDVAGTLYFSSPASTSQKRPFPEMARASPAKKKFAMVILKTIWFLFMTSYKQHAKQCCMIYLLEITHQLVKVFTAS